MSLVSQYFDRKRQAFHRSKVNPTHVIYDEMGHDVNLRRRTINALIQILCANGMEFPDHQTRRPVWTFDSRS